MASLMKLLFDLCSLSEREPAFVSDMVAELLRDANVADPGLRALAPEPASLLAEIVVIVGEIGCPKDRIVLGKSRVHRGANETFADTREIAAVPSLARGTAGRIVVEEGERPEPIVEFARESDNFAASHVVDHVKSLAFERSTNTIDLEHLTPIQHPANSLQSSIDNDLHVMHLLGLTRFNRNKIGEPGDPSNSNVALIDSIYYFVGDVEGKVHAGLGFKDSETSAGQTGVVHGIDVLGREGELAASFAVCGDTSLELKGCHAPFRDVCGHVGVDKVLVVISPIWHGLWGGHRVNTGIQVSSLGGLLKSPTISSDPAVLPIAPILPSALKLRELSAKVPISQETFLAALLKVRIGTAGAALRLAAMVT